MWAPADAGSAAVEGTCAAGLTGTPTRDCLMDGSWSAVSGVCTVVLCAAEDFGNAAWPATNAGLSAAGVCESGYSGNPSRACSLSGSWGAVVDGCMRNVCPSIEDGSAVWPASESLSVAVSGVCNEGYFGSPTRGCDEDGNWQAIENGCEESFCLAVTAANANWASTRAGAVAVGMCIDGFEGTPTRLCESSGVWSATVNDPCAVAYNDCPGELVDRIYFPPSSPGTTVNGTCPTDYRPEANGPPARTCFANGTWDEAYVRPCELIPVESNGNIANLTWVSKTSTQVTLSWDAFNQSANATFRVEVALGSGSFAIANNGGTPAHLPLLRVPYILTRVFVPQPVST